MTGGPTERALLPTPTPVPAVAGTSPATDLAELGPAGGLFDSEPGATPGLGRFVGYQLLSEVALTSGIWILYLQERGYGLGQIGIAEAIFHLAPLTLELPTGSLADATGRKWSLAIGSLCVALAAALMLAIPDGGDAFWLVLFAMYVSGASYTFRSGAQEAFLYDSLAARGAAGGFARFFGRLTSASYVMVAVTVFAGAWLADRSFVWPYALMVGAGLGAVWMAAGLHEPERERSVHRGLLRTVGEALRIVRRKPRLLALQVLGAAFWTVVACLEMYGQPVYRDLGLSTPAIGVLLGGSFVVVAAGTWVAHRVTARGDFRAWTIGLTALVIGGGLALGSGSLVLAVAVFVVMEFGTGLFEPVLADRINRESTAAQRATILSLNGFLFSLNMVWVFPLIGWLAERASWLAAFGAAGALLAAALAGWLVVTARESIDLLGEV
jgi:MFS family permease